MKFKIINKTGLVETSQISRIYKRVFFLIKIKGSVWFQMMEMSMLAPSFPGFAKPSASLKPSLLTLRASSLRHDYPLASKVVVKSIFRSHPLTFQFHLVETCMCVFHSCPSHFQLFLCCLSPMVTYSI